MRGLSDWAACGGRIYHHESWCRPGGYFVHIGFNDMEDESASSYHAVVDDFGNLVRVS